MKRCEIRVPRLPQGGVGNAHKNTYVTEFEPSTQNSHQRAQIRIIITHPRPRKRDYTQETTSKPSTPRNWMDTPGRLAQRVSETIDKAETTRLGLVMIPTTQGGASTYCFKMFFLLEPFLKGRCP